MENSLDTQLSSYDYVLPSALIADRPHSEGRDQCNLLICSNKNEAVQHKKFYEILDHIPDNLMIVFNQSRVIPNRFQAKKKTGGKAEIFLLHAFPIEEGEGFFVFEGMIKTNHKKKKGDCFTCGEKQELLIEILKQEENIFHLKFSTREQVDLKALMFDLGDLPIPPYIRKGISDEQDHVDYQNVYAKDPGSVASPTAGLHFTEELIEKLREKGVQFSYVSLYVSAGTFLPVKTENILEHKMHSEFYKVTQEEAFKIQQHKGPLWAVGTTSLRVLESSYSEEKGFCFTPDRLLSTNLFLYPGKKVRSISGLVTNFHWPQSTLLMLVSSLLGRERTLELYQEAIQKHYRFFSYGDAMLIQLEETL